MKRSTDRIRTTHTGSLPRPPEILEMMRAREAGQPVDEQAFEEKLAKHVDEIVRRQVACGIDVVNDGECGKPAFLAYQAERIGGLEARVPAGGLPVPTVTSNVNGTNVTVPVAQASCIKVDDDRAIRTSVGASVLWASPLGPIRFDYAIALSKGRNDVTQAFRFSGGTSF